VVKEVICCDYEKKRTARQILVIFRSVAAKSESALMRSERGPAEISKNVT